MSRNFGISRRGIPRERYISEAGWDWIRAIAAAAMLLGFMAGIALLEVEFPKGLPPLSELHIAIVSSTAN